MGDNLGWSLPARTWNEFTRHVDAEYGTTVTGSDGDPLRDDDGDLVREATKAEYGRQLQSAMEDFIDYRETGGDDAESTLRDLTESAGLTTTRDHVVESDLHDQETEAVYNRVNPRVKDAFKAYADRHDMRPGVAVGRALEEYLDGGREARIARTVDALQDDLREGLAHMTDVDPDGSDKPGVQERQARTVAIDVQEILEASGEDLTTSDINESISALVGDTDHHRETKRPLVKRRLNLARHPLKGEPVWIHTDDALRVAEDVGIPEEIARPPRDLDGMDLQWRVIYAAARPLAVHGHQRTTVDASEILGRYLDADFFDQDDVREIVDGIDMWDGVEVDGRGHSATIQIDLQALAQEDPAEYNAIVQYAEAPAAPLDDTAEDGVTASIDDWTTTSAPSDTSGGVASDGGQDDDTSLYILPDSDDDQPDAEPEPELDPDPDPDPDPGPDDAEDSVNQHAVDDADPFAALDAADTVDPDDDPLDDVDQDLRPDATAERRHHED